MRVDQVELDFRRNDRMPAFRLVKVQHHAQHVSRRRFDRLTVSIYAIGKYRCRRVLPSRGPGGKVSASGLQQHIAVFDIVVVVRIFTRYRLGKYAFRQLQLAATHLCSRQYFAAGSTGHVRNEGLDIVYRMFNQPRLNGVFVTHEAPDLRPAYFPARVAKSF